MGGVNAANGLLDGRRQKGLHERGVGGRYKRRGGRRDGRTTGGLGKRGGVWHRRIGIGVLFGLLNLRLQLVLEVVGGAFELGENLADLTANLR